MHTGLITDLAIVTMVAAVTGMLSRRIGQPSILGYLLAGLIVGPYIPIPLFADPQRMGELAEVGVVLVMFAVGLEFRVKRLLEILPVSGLTAAAQIGALAWAGYTVGSLMGWSTAASICLGAMVSISSTMVVSGVLRVKPVDPDVRAHVFGILVVQDVVAIVLMAVVTAIAKGESVGLESLGLLVGQLAGVVIAMLVVGLLILPRLVRFAVADTEVLVVLVVGAAFGLSMAAELFGYSVALGAFISGMAVAESGRGQEVEHAIEPLRGLFSAIFFVSIGMSVDPVVAWGSLPLALTLCAVVIGMQFFSVTLTTVLTGSSLRRGIYSGLALGQIGELSFILASIAIAGGVVPKETLPALVTVATITAFTTPLLLGRAQGLIEMLDHRLPDRAQQVLAAYQAFVRRTRARGDASVFRRPALAVVLDWSALVVLFVVHSTVSPRVDGSLAVAVDAGAVVLAAPFVMGLLRSGVRLVKGVRTLARKESGPTPRAKAVEAVALLAIVLGVGLPTLALIQPLVRGHWVEGAVLGLLLIGLVALGWHLRRVQGDYTSGVAQIALDLAEHVGGEAEEDEEAPHPTRTPIHDALAGLDYQHIAVGAASIDGQTLAALDLRCRTGATIVDIERDGHTTPLPTGHEQLQLHDVLAVSGSKDAIARARAILEDGDPAPSAAA